MGTRGDGAPQGSGWPTLADGADGADTADAAGHEWADLGGDTAGWDVPLAVGEDATAGALLQEVAEQTTYGEIFLADLIRRQRRLALSVAGVFLALLCSLPLLNLLLPRLADLPILGLPLAWVLLGILVYPLLWVLGWYFTTTAATLEDEFVDLVR